jgi:hypothetical protein
MALTDNFEGNIQLGKSSNNSEFSHLRNSVSCILQDFSQYQMTIEENIEAGNIDYKFSDEQILELLEKVGLKDIRVGKIIRYAVPIYLVSARDKCLRGVGIQCSKVRPKLVDRELDRRGISTGGSTHERNSVAS